MLLPTLPLREGRTAQRFGEGYSALGDGLLNDRQSFGFIQDIAIPETQNAIAAGLKPIGSSTVTRRMRAIRVLTAVQLDYSLCG